MQTLHPSQIDEQRRSLDANGLRYLISIRSFYLINSGQSTPGTDTPSLSSAIAGAGRERLRYRDIVWAFFSESQEILLAASSEACGGKMSWKDARALGVFLWLQSNDSIVSVDESLRSAILGPAHSRYPAESTSGGRGSESIHGRGGSRSYGLLSTLFRSGQGETGPWIMETGSVAS